MSKRVCVRFRDLFVGTIFFFFEDENCGTPHKKILLRRGKNARRMGRSHSDFHIGDDCEVYVEPAELHRVEDAIVHEVGRRCPAVATC